MNTSRPRILALAALIALASLASSARADDTDIYLNPSSGGGGEPMVMFSIDYRANLFSVACNLPGSTIADINSCGYGASVTSTLAEDGAHNDAKISLYELIRASLTEVIEGLDNVKVGLMMSHAHFADCEGPGRTQCSNGGMILSGFNSLSASDDIDQVDTARDGIDNDGDGTIDGGDPDELNALNAKAAFRRVLRQIPSTPGIAGLPDAHSYQIKETYFELFRYLTGQAVYNGTNGWRDFDASNGAKSRNLDDPEPADAGFNVDGIYFYPSWDTSIISGTDYISPLVDAECTRVFVINVGFGTANQDDDSDAAIAAAKSDGGINLSLSGSNEQAQLFEFFKDVDLGDGSWGTVGNLAGKQNITSYFVMSSANNTQNAWAVGGGTGSAVELGSDPDAIVEKISNIFKSILAVSTTFVAPSVPVNVFNRAQTLNEVYLALFEADEVPAWPGNLKKLVIGSNSLGQLELQDASTPPIGAIDVDGRIKREAITYWTNVAGLPPIANDDEIAGADGRAIKRGGAGQKIPGLLSGGPGRYNSTAGARQLYTDDMGDTFTSATSANVTDNLMPLDWTRAVYDEILPELGRNYTAAQSADAALPPAITAYLRGLQSDATTARDWLLGDPLHSRPLPINFGARSTGFDTSNPDIRILMGTNDGYMHMFQNTDASGAQSGVENWAFIPRAALPPQIQLYTAATVAPKHPITTDGSPVALLVDGNFDGTLSSGGGTTDKAIVMFGQRRGGRNLYALDVINPDAPALKWMIEGGSTGTTGFAELTQTWSTVQLGRVRLGSASATPINAAAFGGGYNGDDTGTGTFAACDALAAGAARDACFAALGKDAKNRAYRERETPLLGADDDEGNAIFIINAETGALIWKFKQGSAGVNIADKTTFHPLLRDSIPAETVLLDTTGNGVSDRIYVADTGGTVWRVDLAGPYDHDSDSSTPDIIVDYVPSVWQITPLLSVGRHDTETSGIANDRRFFNRIDVVQSRDSVGPFDAVLLGSGDRADPQSTSENDWFYLLKDRNISSGRPPTLEPNGSDALPMEASDLPDLTSNCLQRDTLANCGISNLNNGWRIELANNGEKNLAASITSGGNIFFTTFEPSPPDGGICGLSEGTGRVYALSLQDATAVINFDTTNDADPPPGETVNYDRSDQLGSGGIPVEVVPIGGGKILIQGQEAGENIVSTGAKTNLRTYWHERY